MAEFAGKGPRILGLYNAEPEFKLPRVVHCINVPGVLSKKVSRQKHPNPIRQYNYSGHDQWHGGATQSLDTVTRTIFRYTIQHNISITARFLAVRDNTIADKLSRSKYEWQLHPALFRYLDRVFGPHQVDRFASMASAQLPVYNSLYRDPCTSGVDAFAQDWSQVNNYVNAPFALIPRVLQLVKQGATATVIAQEWRAQPWYRELVKMAVAPPIGLPISNRTVRSVGSAEPLKNRWRIFAWKISGLQG